MYFVLGSVFVLLFGICFSTQNVPDVDCNLPADSGMCYAYFPMFFYDASSGDCINFIYGGCGGNSNKFWSKEECLEKCGVAVGGSGKDSVGGGEGAIIQEPIDDLNGAAFLHAPPSDVCNQEKQPGNCSSQINRYYFDKDSRKCERFIYTDCGGNENNFIYEFECERTCPGGRDFGDICSFEKKTGPCKAYFPRFYFSKETGQCEEFIFGGCQGNHNNFKTKEECLRFCSSGKGSPLP